MIPEIDVQLAAIGKSLADNVLPALDPANPMAIEQLHLGLATLALVRQRLPDVHHYLRRDIEDNLRLAAELLTLLGRPDEALVAEGERILADPENGPRELEAEQRRLKAGIADLIDAARGTDGEAALAGKVLEAQDAMIARSRAWSSPMGFEPDPAAVPPLEALLERKAAR